MADQPGLMSDLARAWDWRGSRGFFQSESDCALRVFHGPGEGNAGATGLAIDRFGPNYWLTTWNDRLRESDCAVVVDFLVSQGAQCIVRLDRDKAGGVPSDSRRVFGKESAAGGSSVPIVVQEAGLRFNIQLVGVKHPGLFLDHLPLRQWLAANCRGLRVLNTFAYTGSLSVAAAQGGAQEVVTLDLAKPAIQWAQANWALNPISVGSEFIAGDYFEWLPRWHRAQRKFDCVILDPPSFSRGKKGTFSTAKDLKKLHLLAMQVLAPGGYLVTSINSANVTHEKYQLELLAAAKDLGMVFNCVRSIDLPETFPTALGRPEDRYLKGWILRRIQ